MPASFSEIGPGPVSEIFLLPGIYNVKLFIHSQGFTSVYERQVTILNKPLVHLGPDTTICENSVYTLSNKYPHSPFNEKFLWSTGDTAAGKAGVAYS